MKILVTGGAGYIGSHTCKLLKNQNRKDYAFLKKNDPLIKKHLKLNKYKSKIIKVL